MKNIEDLVRQFKQLKILVIGDAILDIYTRGTIDKICREAPAPVLNVQERAYQCGGAANTAINVAALGAETYFLTVLGRDAHASELLTVLRRHHVHTRYILRDKTRTTIAKQRIVAAPNILLRTDEGSVNDISERYCRALLQKLSVVYDRMDAIILSDYGYGLFSNDLISGMQQITAARSIPVIVDARDVKRYTGLHATAVKPNFEETQRLLNEKIVSERVNRLIKKAPQILSLSGARTAVVTLDMDGVILCEKGKQPWHIPCTPREQTKTIGAGDTFTGALSLALAAGAAAKTATEIAAAAAAIVVQKNGTAVCSNDELMSCFTPDTKFTTPGRLSKLVKELRSQGKKIVFTNGCFDILHKGHISLLQQARDAGDLLIVGVNNDESIRAVKGAGRPINTLEDRITVLAGLQSVDYLVAFAEQNATHLIQALRPDIFVKGGNYTEQSIPELPTLKKLGCAIKIIPYIDDHSTSYIIDKIRHIREPNRYRLVR